MSHPFTQRLQQHGVLDTGTAPTTAPTTAGNGHGYAGSALASEAFNVANAAVGTRNHTLNTAAFNLGSLIDAGAIDAGTVTDTLTTAARHAGLADKEIGDTIASGLRGSAAKVGPRRIPTLDSDITEVDPADLNGSSEQTDLHHLAVTKKAYDLRVHDEGRALWTRQRAALMGQQPPHMVTMADFLSVPDEDTIYRVDGLFPVGARVLLAAQYKAGKTSMIANLLRCLVDGDPFLGRYPVAPIGKILLIDTELDERTLRRWLRDQTITNIDGINILCLRGRLTSFAITDDQNRAEWAQRIRGAELIMLDCLRPCLDALGLSEDKEAGVFLTAFDALCREAGAGEAVVVHHMGHHSERSRGDSRLMDWPDALWKVIRETDDEGADDDTGTRFFSALGRDVLVGESELDWNPVTRSLTVCGAGRSEKKVRDTIDHIADILRDEPGDGLTQNQLKTRLVSDYGVGRNAAVKAIHRAVTEAILVVRTGPRESKIHTLNPSYRGGAR